MSVPDQVRAWDPGVPGVREVLHARWADHHYPAHTHDAWTVLIVDDGRIGYDVDRHRDAATAGAGVTLLPPHVPHDGHPLTASGFRKRVVYLETAALPERLIGRCVDAPLLLDDRLRAQASLLDGALAAGERPAARDALAILLERLEWHLSGHPAPNRAAPIERARLARRARDLLDADPIDPPTITEIARGLEVSAAYLIRAFTREFAIPPHQYVVGRRLDAARRLLLDGRPAAEVAVATGFYDQAHLHRHFRRLLRTSPGRFRARTGEVNFVQDR
ncbi:helix-turn-helix transcriptional regulator [Flexivirga meconopsidis]|uniref:helix-turn-helix transcriptional regulator n=1 Tax=Flexivirga meconopsidis TaxID=2977121 RepID=UPI00223FC2D7|nr:AraC family transcriptional regulator [Flexivirga meconopsidis]